LRLRRALGVEGKRILTLGRCGRLLQGEEAGGRGGLLDVGVRRGTIGTRLSAGPVLAVPAKHTKRLQK
jgi:hypothetical protein